MVVEAFVAVSFSVLRFGLGVLLPQPSPHALPQLPLHVVEHLRAVGIMKVADPSSHPAIHEGENFFGFLPVGAPGCFFPDRLPQLAAAFWAGFTMRVVPAAARFPPRQPEPQEIEALFLEVHDSRLLFIELEPLSFQPGFQPPVHLHPLPFPTENDEVIGVSAAGQVGRAFWKLWCGSAIHGGEVIRKHLSLDELRIYARRDRHNLVDLHILLAKYRNGQTDSFAKRRTLCVNTGALK